MQRVTISVSFSDEQAWLYAQFLKRVTWGDYRERAMNDDEAYVMIDAGELIREELRERGYAPR
jgi:hypothetical protein